MSNLLPCPAPRFTLLHPREALQGLGHPAARKGLHSLPGLERGPVRRGPAAAGRQHLLLPLLLRRRDCWWVSVSPIPKPHTISVTSPHTDKPPRWDRRVLILSPVWASPDTTGLGAVAVMRGDAERDGQQAGAKFGILAPCFLPSRPPLPSRCGRQPVHLQGRPLLGGASQRQRQPAPAPARPLARAPCRHRRLRLLPAQPQLLLLQRSVRRRLWLVSVRPVLLCPSGSAPAPPAWCGAGVLGVAGCWGCRLLAAVLVTGSKQMHFGEKMLSGDAQLLAAG